MNRIVLDIETGGFSKEKNALCSVAAIVFDENFVIHDQIYLLIKPHRRKGSDEPASYKPDAMAVNGLTVDHLEEHGVYPGVAMGMLEGMFKKYEVITFIGHNAKYFDIPWLTEYMQRFGDGYKFQNIIDTLELSRNHWNLPNYDLGNICMHLGIQHTNAHHALGDCWVTLELYRRLQE